MKKEMLLIIGSCFLLAGCGDTAPINSAVADTESVTEESTVQEETFTDTEEETEPVGNRTSVDDLKKLPQEIQNVIYGDGVFYDLEFEKEFTRATYQLPKSDGENNWFCDATWEEFAVADVDQDDDYEFLVYLSTAEGFDGLDCEEARIFDFSNGTVYAHPHPFRGVSLLYENGVLVGSSGAADNQWYTLQYEGETETEKVLAYSKTDYFCIGEEEVSEDEFYDYIYTKYGSYDQEGEVARILWSKERCEDVT